MHSRFRIVSIKAVFFEVIRAQLLQEDTGLIDWYGGIPLA
jgi:hypothetical protein